MEHRTGSSDAWARLAQEIVTSTSWRALGRIILLVLACTPAAVAVALAVVAWVVLLR
jgi:hypothetical protein